MSQLFHAISQRATPAVFSEDKVRANDANRSRSHDLVGQRIGHHAVLVNAGLVCEGVGSNNSFVWRAAEADELAEKLACRVELVHLNVVGVGELVAAYHQRSGDLFERSIAGTFADAVDGALYLPCASLNAGE